MAIRNDRDGDYDSPFEKLCSTHRMIHLTTNPQSSQSNGIDEFKNRTLKEMINVMLISLELRRSFAFPQLHSQQIVSQKNYQDR